MFPRDEAAFNRKKGRLPNAIYDRKLYFRVKIRNLNKNTPPYLLTKGIKNMCEYIANLNENSF